MKKLSAILAVVASTTVSHLHAQSIDFGMTAATINSPTTSTIMVGGGFQLLGITPSSGFNPTNATLANILSTANMLSVSNSFATISALDGGQFYNAGLPVAFSTGTAISTGAQLFVLASASPTFSAASPWALITGSDSSWLSPNAADPFGFTSIEISLAGNQIIASSGAATAFFGSSAPGSQIANADNLNLVPEPSTYALLAMSGVGMAGYMIRRRRRA